MLHILSSPHGRAKLLSVVPYLLCFTGKAPPPRPVKNIIIVLFSDFTFSDFDGIIFVKFSRRFGAGKSATEYPDDGVGAVRPGRPALPDSLRARRAADRKLRAPQIPSRAARVRRPPARQEVTPPRLRPGRFDPLAAGRRRNKRGRKRSRQAGEGEKEKVVSPNTKNKQTPRVRKHCSHAGSFPFHMEHP